MNGYLRRREPILHPGKSRLVTSITGQREDTETLRTFREAA
jgi:hypothetical protein